MWQRLSSAFSSLRQSWQELRGHEAAEQQKNPNIQTDREFLPAALEIQESPPSPTARIFVWGMCALFIIAVTWATFGKVDIVAVGQGKVVPSGKTKIIQPFETGVIHAIHVKDGQQVKAGDALLSLDITQTQADRARLDGELQMTKAEIARLNAFIEDKAKIAAIEGVPQTFISSQNAMLQQERLEAQSRLKALENTVAEKASELKSVEKTVERLQATLPLITRRHEMVANLAKEGLSSKINALTIEEEMVGQVKELSVQQERAHQVAAALEAAKNQLQSQKAELKKRAMNTLVEKQKRKVQLENELAKTEKRQALQKLVAPIDGVVQEMKVNTIGGVVTPAQELMKVVPINSRLEAEVFLKNKDIGFVNEGQKVAVKFEAFPFTKYGLIEGKVQHVSHDAIQDEKQGLIYKAKVALNKDTLTVNGKDVRVSPGMSVTGEIKTGQRRIIEYFLSPILKYQAEVIRER